MSIKTLQTICLSLTVTVLVPLHTSADEYSTSVIDSAMQDTNSSVSNSSATMFQKLLEFRDERDSLLNFCFARDGEAFGHSAEGGEFRVYFIKSEPVMRHITYYGERGKSEYSIYFEDSIIRAVETKSKRYNQSIDDEGDLEIVNVDMQLLYFADSGEVLCFDKAGTPIERDIDSLAQDVEFYREISQEYLKEAGF